MRFVLIKFISTVSLFLCGLAAHAVPTYMVYQGQVFDPSGNPLEEASVDFKVSIFAPGGACLLYEEVHSAKNMTSSGGVFSLEVGNGTPTGIDPGIGLYSGFNNLDGGVVACYPNPVQGDVREVKVEFTTASAGTVSLANQKLESVPYAMYATSLDGVAHAVGNKIGIGTKNPIAQLEVNTNGGVEYDNDRKDVKLGSYLSIGNTRVNNQAYIGANAYLNSASSFAVGNYTRFKPEWAGSSIAGGLVQTYGAQGSISYYGIDWQSSTDEKGLFNGDFTHFMTIDGKSQKVAIGKQIGSGKLEVEYTTIDNVTKNTLNVNRIVELTADATSYDKAIYGRTSDFRIPTGVTDSGYKVGVDASAYSSNDTLFSGTLASSRGLWARAGVSRGAPGAVINDTRAVSAEVITSDADVTINNAYGVHIHNGSGVTPVTNEYGLYQATARVKNYFAGDVGVDTVNPEADVDIRGYAAIQNGSTIILTVDSSLPTDIRGRRFATVNEAVTLANKVFSDDSIRINVLAGTHIVDPFLIYSRRRIFQLHGSTGVADDVVLDFSGTASTAGSLISGYGSADIRDLRVLGPAIKNKHCIQFLAPSNGYTRNVKTDSCNYGFRVGPGGYANVTNSETTNSKYGVVLSNSRMNLSNYTGSNIDFYGASVGTGASLVMSTNITFTNTPLTCTACTSIFANTGSAVLMGTGTYNFSNSNQQLAVLRASTKSSIMTNSASITTNLNCENCTSALYADNNSHLNIGGTINVDVGTAGGAGRVLTMLSRSYAQVVAACNIINAERALYSGGMVEVNSFSCAPTAEGGTNVHDYGTASLYSPNGLFTWTPSTWGL